MYKIQKSKFKNEKQTKSFFRKRIKKSYFHNKKWNKKGKQQHKSEHKNFWNLKNPTTTKWKQINYEIPIRKLKKKWMKIKT